MENVEIRKGINPNCSEWSNDLENENEEVSLAAKREAKAIIDEIIFELKNREWDH